MELAPEFELAQFEPFCASARPAGKGSRLTQVRHAGYTGWNIGSSK
jgi:hypothetical protein